LIVPAVVVLNEYEYDTFVAETWLLDTVQLMFVSVEAAAGIAVSASALAPITAAPRASRVSRFRGRMPAGFAARRFISFLSGRRAARGSPEISESTRYRRSLTGVSPPDEGFAAPPSRNHGKERSSSRREVRPITSLEWVT
jgi:hypothetical protein